jgi:hypothetical protein
MSNQTETAGMRKDLEDLIKKLADARNKFESNGNEAKFLLSTVTETEEYQALIEEKEQAAKEKDSLTLSIQELVEKIYKAEGEKTKKVHDKASVSIGKKVSITDPSAMIEWVKVKLADAVSETIDEKMVKDHMLKHGSIPGMVVTEEIKVKIASEL